MSTGLWERMLFLRACRSTLFLRLVAASILAAVLIYSALEAHFSLQSLRDIAPSAHLHLRTSLPSSSTTKPVSINPVSNNPDNHSFFRLLLDREPPRRNRKGDLFSMEHKEEPVDTVFNATFAAMINDYHEPETCAKMSSVWDADTVRYAGEMMHVLSLLAEVEQIPIVLAFGTLLGYARDKQFIPYDADLDVFVPDWAYDRLVKYQSLFPINHYTTTDRVDIVLHPEHRFVPEPLQRRYSCSGHVVPGYEGMCSFVGFLGRALYHHRHVDFFPADHVPEEKRVFYGAGRILNVPEEWFFPLRPCTFMGARFLCPNDYPTLLRGYYGPLVRDLRPTWLCSNGTWVDYKRNPTLHQEKLKSWLETYGDRNKADVARINKESTVIFNDERCKLYGKYFPPEEFGYCNYPPTTTTTTMEPVIPQLTSAGVHES